MTVETVSELSTVLDKLAGDDAFRASLAANPVAALASLGISIDPADVPAVRNLPSKASIAADRAAIEDKLESTSGMVIFLLSGKE